MLPHMDENQSSSSKETILHHPKAMKVMSKVSKLAFTLSSLVLSAVLLLALYKVLPRLRPTEIETPRPVVTILPTVIQNREPTIASLPITLDGPLTCSYSSDEATVSASILQRKLYLGIDEATSSSRFLMRDNCSYTWSPLTNTGEKNCDMQKIIQTANFMSSLGLLNMNQIIKIIPTRTEHSLYNNPITINKIISTCQKVATDEAFFVVPWNVVFTETDTQPKL